MGTPWKTNPQVRETDTDQRALSVKSESGWHLSHGILQLQHYGAK